jgi:hypothetical protein
MDINNKLHNYLKITRIINNLFRPKKLTIRLYNTLALPTVLHSSENWAIKPRHATRITAAETKYTRRTAGYTWTLHKTNTEVAN